MVGREVAPCVFVDVGLLVGVCVLAGRGVHVDVPVAVGVRVDVREFFADDVIFGVGVCVGVLVEVEVDVEVDAG
jgi:hypothetical protein